MLEDKKPYERKIVYFINDSEFDNLKYEDEGKELLTNPEVVVIPMKESESFRENFEIMGGVNIENRMMLVQSPYSDTKYAEVATSNEDFALEKLANILCFSALLGAKSVTINNIFEETDTSSSNIKGEANYGLANAKVEHQSTNSNKLKQQIGYTSNFSGGECNYKGAEAFLRKKGMAGDVFLSNILEMASLENNKMKKVERNIRLTANIKRTKELLASIKTPVASGGFKTTSERMSEKEYILDVSIEF